MGLRKWADRQVRKRDIRRAIQETHFQIILWQGLKAALEVTEHEQEVLARFDGSLPEYLDALVSGLRESEARLWGFKGNATQWTGSQDMISSGVVSWDADKRESLLLADVLLSDFRGRLTHALDELSGGNLTAQETRVIIKSEIDGFCERGLSHRERLEDEAIKQGLANHKSIEKHKVVAEKRVGAVIRTVLL